VSLLCEWSWAIRISAASVIALYWEPKAAPMQMLYWRNNIEAGHTPSPGLFSLYYYPQLFLHVQNLAPFFFNRIISNNQHKQFLKNLVYEPCTWTNLGAIFLPGLTIPLS
jgi:hypothetical protein